MRVVMDASYLATYNHYTRVAGSDSLYEYEKTIDGVLWSAAKRGHAISDPKGTQPN